MIFTSPLGSFTAPVVDSYSLLFDPSARLHGTPPRSDLSAFVDPVTDTSISFGQLKDRVGQFASGLVTNLGFKKWQVVALFSPNHLDFPTVVFGTLKAGGTLTLANPGYNARELAFQLKDSGARYLFTTKDVVKVATDAAKDAGISPRNIFVLGNDAVSGHISVGQILSRKVVPKVHFTKEELTTKPAYLCYSSGTTGKPKGVITTHFNMVANICQFTQAEFAPPNFPDREMWIGVLPWYHIYGLNLSLHCSIYTGSGVVLMAKFDFIQFLENIQKYKIGAVHLVPPIALAMAKHPIVDKYDLSSVKYCMSGAAPLGPELTTEFVGRLKTVIKQGYGMTELSPVSHIAPSDNPVPGSVGRLVPGAEARLVDPETQKDLGYNEDGELWIRGPMVMKGYLNNPQGTAETIVDGWLRTGDVARVDDQDNFYIVDRLKELIKYKGFQVPPAELEGILLGHPAIDDVAVIPRPDERGGEVPVAFVVLKPTKKISAEEIVEFLNSKVSDHKRLRGGVTFIDVIPKAASGKILRRLLRDLDRQNVEKLRAKL